MLGAQAGRAGEMASHPWVGSGWLWGPGVCRAQLPSLASSGVQSAACEANNRAVTERCETGSRRANSALEASCSELVCELHPCFLSELLKSRAGMERD